MLPILILFCLPALTHAYTSFETNCTLPPAPPHFNYVSSPNVRGTLDIAWSCIFTIISCTWTIQHPNIPWQRGHFKPGFFGWLIWKYLNSLVLVGWFLATIIAPEYLLTRYLDDYLQSRNGLEDFARFAKEDNVEWTASHYQFALMGGFVMRTNVKSYAAQSSDRSVQNELRSREGTSDGRIMGSRSPFPSPTEEQGALIDQDPLPSLAPVQQDESQDHQKINFKRCSQPNRRSTPVWPESFFFQPNPFYLRPRDILMLRKEKFISHLPEISEEEIRDRSKEDNLMRIIAMIQILWLCIQVITRAVANLAVTQLEVATVGFAICAIITYILGWDKPKGVNIPITILNIDDSGEKVHALLSSTVKSKSNPIFMPNNQERRYEHVIPDNASSVLGFGISGTIFGSLHLAAWAFAFPSRIEMILWRVAAIYCTCFPFLLLISRLSWIFKEGIQWEHKLREHWDSPRFAEKRGRLYRLSASTDLISFWNLVKEMWSSSKWAFILLAIYCASASILILAYIAARLFLLVEMLRTLAYQPSTAYIGTWTVNIPYVS